MQRRSFMKKSVAAAIVAATPLALTGLVNAAGGGGGTETGTDTTGFFDSTVMETTIVQTIETAVCTGFQKRYDVSADVCWQRWECQFPDGSVEIRYANPQNCPTLEDVFNDLSLRTQFDECRAHTSEVMPSMACETAAT